MKTTFLTNQKTTAFYMDQVCVGEIKTPSGCVDRFIRLEEGVYRWERISDLPVDHMEMAFKAAYKMEYQMMPALMYDQNTRGDIITHGQIEKLERHEEVHQEPNFPVGCIDPVTGEVRKIAWWRSSVPGATYTEGNGVSLGMFLPPDQLDASVSILPEEKQTTHTAYWPLTEGPRVKEWRAGNPDSRPPAFKDEDMTKGIPERKMTGPYSETIEPRRTFAVILVFAAANEPRRGWHKLMSFSWKMNRKYLAPKFSNEDLWDLGIEYMKSMYCEGENGFHSFALGKVFLDGKWVIRPYYRFEMGWTGQAIAAGANMLAEAIRRQDKEAEEMGFTALDDWLKQKLPSGMLPTHLMGQQFTHNGRRVIDACNLSAGAISYFRAWEYAQVLGKSRPEYYEAACRICDFALEKMEPNGRIAKSWYEDTLETAIEEGYPGAFLGYALCEGAKRTHRSDYLEGAVRCYDYFYAEFMKTGYAMGGAQDHFSVDKESGIPLLRSAISLYELTGDKRYLSCAKDAAQYLSTWQWQFTHPLKKDSLLGAFDFDTYGGTLTSIGAGIDHYAVPYVHELHDLAELTGEEEWAERARAAWAQATIGLSDGSLVIGGHPMPRGAQNEAFTLGRDYEDSPFAWLPTWMAAFRVESLCRTMFPGGDRFGRIL